MYSERDQFFMKKALKLAKHGLGLTSPNPAVGALIVKDGKILGQGWHHRAGLAHAEIEAIQKATQSGKSIRGSTLYITLEPCCTWGRTPPCVDAIICAGIQKVVVGCIDPNPKHAGKGLVLLRRKKVKVVKNVLEKECRALNEAWNYWITHRRPWVIAKCGMSLDGKIATKTGESQWITSTRSRQLANKLRGFSDAVLVGIGTILKDNPELNLRFGSLKKQKKLWKVILDSQGRTPLKSKVFKEGKVWIFTTQQASSKKVEQLRQQGAIVSIAPHPNRRGIDLNYVLKTLGKSGITNLLVEGGGEVLGSFFLQRKVQEIRFFIAPVILGGKESKRAVEGAGFSKWKDSSNLENFEISRLGTDLLVEGKIKT